MPAPQLQTLMQKEVSRKEFLGFAALAIGSIFGFGTIIKLLTGKSLHSQAAQIGYGGSDYGGKKNKTNQKTTTS